MRIDFVSDVACPWCAIGLNALERALERIGGDLGDVEIHMQPFELNPTMSAEGVDAAAHAAISSILDDERSHHDRAAQEPRQGIFWPRVLKPAVSAATEFVIWTGMKL